MYVGTWKNERVRDHLFIRMFVYMYIKIGDVRPQAKTVLLTQTWLIEQFMMCLISNRGSH